MHQFGKVAFAVLLICACTTTTASSANDNTSTDKQSAPGIPIDRFTGLALPLKPNQKIIPTLDGKCGLLGSDITSFERTLYNWLGSCRFGLMHGRGFQMQDGKYVPVTMTYGYLEFKYVPRKGYTKIYDASREPSGDFDDLNTFGDVKFNSVRLEVDGDTISLNRRAGERQTGEFFGLRSYSCPFTAFPDPPNALVSKQLERSAKKACAGKPAGGKALYIITQTYRHIRAADGSWPDDPNPARDLRVCATTATRDIPSCSAETQAILAPLSARIATIMEADKTAAQRWREELTSRFAPLEQAARDNISGFARSRGRQ